MSVSTSTGDRLAYEARVRMPYAAIAGIAGVLLTLAVAVELGGPHAKVDEITLGLITANERVGRDVVFAVLDLLAYVGLGVTLHFLWGAARSRRTEIRPRWLGMLALVGGVLTGVAVLFYIVVYARTAGDFVSHGNQTYVEANQMLSSATLVVPQFANDLGLLLAALGFVMVSMNAMRVGLLPRFLGYLGMFAGALVIFPLVPIPIVATFWMLAVAYLLSGRWPNGVPPAWSTGRAEPWPSSADLRQQRTKQRLGRPGRTAEPPKPARETAPRTTRASTPKRKRKHRS
jgi:hypothetical protein